MISQTNFTASTAFVTSWATILGMLLHGALNQASILIGAYNGHVLYQNVRLKLMTTDRDLTMSAVGLKVAHPRYRKLDSLQKAMVFMALRGDSNAFAAFYDSRPPFAVIAPGLSDKQHHEKKGTSEDQTIS